MFKEFLRNKKKIIPILVTSLLVGTTIFFINSQPTSSKETKDMTPTVFVHGFKGGPRTFSTMMQRFQDRNWGSKRMVVFVSDHGNLTVRGGIPHTMNPFIQVIFENDRASIKHQTYWIQKVMKNLYQKHGIHQVNLVGHSMGGLASTNFLLNNQSGDYPRVDKLAVLASPFKGIDKEGYFSMNQGMAAEDLKPGSEALIKMMEEKENFDSHVEVLAIAGVINKSQEKAAHWDGLVHESSVKGIQSIVPTDYYHEKTVYDRIATHSGIHETPEVDRILGEFLWNIRSK